MRTAVPSRSRQNVASRTELRLKRNVTGIALSVFLFVLVEILHLSVMTPAQGEDTENRVAHTP